MKNIVQIDEADTGRESRIEALARREAERLRNDTREILRERKRRLVMEGKCPQCATPMPKDSAYNHCDECRRKAREHMRRKKVGKNMKTEDVAAEIEAALEPIVTKARSAGLLVGGALKVMSRESPQEPWQLKHVRHVITVSGATKNVSPVSTHSDLPEMKSKNPAFTGAICGKCGSSQMVQAGKCPVCLNCGDTESCG